MFLFGRLQGARGPGHRAAHPVRPAGGEGRPARALPRGAAADLHHEGQRADQHRLPRLLEGLRPGRRRSPRSPTSPARRQALAATTLRAVIGDIPLDDVLAKREEINHILRAKLDEVTERWGVKITERRDPRDRAAARHPGRDEPPDERRAQPARGHHRVGGHAPGDDQRGRGRQAVEHPPRRGRAPVPDPPRRGLRQRAADDLRRGAAASTRRRWRSSTSRRSRRSPRARARSGSCRWSSRELTRPISNADAPDGCDRGARYDPGRPPRPDDLGGLVRELLGRAVGLRARRLPRLRRRSADRGCSCSPRCGPFLPETAGAPATPADLGLDYEPVRLHDR